MSGVVLLGLWCLVGGVVGGSIGHSSGRLGTGLLLGSFCGVFGWVLLAGAAPRQRVTVAPALPEAGALHSGDAAVPTLPTLPWTTRLDDEAIAANAGQR